MVNGDEILNITQVAEYIGIHKITLYRLIKDQKIPAFKIGRQWRFKKKLLDKWIEENTTKKHESFDTLFSKNESL